MTQPLQYGRNYLGAIQQFVQTNENIQLYANMAATNSTLIASSSTTGSYLADPAARTDLTASNMAAIQQAALALQTWLTTPSSATNGVAPLTQFYLAM